MLAHPADPQAGMAAHRGELVIAAVERQIAVRSGQRRFAQQYQMGDLQHHFITVPAIRASTETLEQLFEVDRFVGLFRHIQIKLNFLLGTAVRVLLAKMHVELRRVISHDHRFELLHRVGAAAFEQTELLERVLDHVAKGFIEHVHDTAGLGL